MTGDDARGSRDREAFAAMLLGVLGGGRRLRDGLDEALAVAPRAAARRRLDTRDYALLGLLAFSDRVETLLGRISTDAQSPSEGADPRRGDPPLSGLLR